jgi:hypothetical protein
LKTELLISNIRKQTVPSHNTNPAALYNDDQSTFLTALPKALSTVYVFSAPISTTNSNFQQSPLIVPTFYKMAMSNQPKGINAFTIGKSLFVDVALSKDAVLNVTNSSESFIPIQRIINDKVKLTFNEYPEEGELRNLQPKKKCAKH